MNELNTAWQSASQEIYAASGAENAGTSGGSQGGDTASSDAGSTSGGSTVSDVEYEEVDENKKK